MQPTCTESAPFFWGGRRSHEGDNMKCQQNEQMYEYSIIIPMDIPHTKSNILAPCKYSV